MANLREKSDFMIFLFKCVLGVLYIVMGIVVYYIKDNLAFESYPESLKIAFSVICILYGAFRLYRAFNAEKMEEE